RIVEDADLPRRQKCRHSLRITGPWQRAGDDDAVVAGEHPGEALTVTIRQQLPQPSLRLPRLLRLSYPVWFRLGRLTENAVDCHPRPPWVPRVTREPCQIHDIYRARGMPAAPPGLQGRMGATVAANFWRPVAGRTATSLRRAAMPRNVAVGLGLMEFPFGGVG